MTHISKYQCLANVPKIELRSSTATGIYRQIVLLAKLFEESETVALTAVSSLKLFQQKDHCVMDQTQNTGTSDVLKRQRPQPC